jgi:hypothetical protein
VYHDPLGRHWTKGLRYYSQTLAYVSGAESRQQFDSYFDKRTKTTSALDREMEKINAAGKSAYIWGEYPWVYAQAELTPFSRYVTSYYIIESDQRGKELMSQLQATPPAYVIISSDAEPRPDRSPTKERYARVLQALHAFVSTHYTEVSKIGSATVYSLNPGTSSPASAESH